MTEQFVHMQSHRVHGSRAEAGAVRPVRPVSGTPSSVGTLSVLLKAAFIVFIFSSYLFAATPPGTVINNTAAVRYMEGADGPFTIVSNIASITTDTQRTVSSLELLQYAAGSSGAQAVSVDVTFYSTSGTPAGPFAPLAPPVHTTAGSGPAPIDLSSPVPLLPAAEYHLGEPAFVRVSDGDQNLDPAAIDSVLVTIQNPATGDSEVLRLSETSVSSGVFTGYIQTGPGPASAGNGILNVADQSAVTAFYADAADAADASSVSALIDPVGMVFSSGTGLPVDGAVVTLVDAATGLPATVYGDDGVSPFPASITSGGSAVDGSGKVYAFNPGMYRFPFVPPGQYRLAVSPPADYRAPSQVSTAVLQALPGAPFAIVVPGSRGEDFLVDPGPAIRLDIPIDPVGTGLWLVKTAGKQTAAVGDFIPYRLTVESTSATGVVPGISIVDRLPHGFRYRKGSVRLNGSPTADPAISGDGRSLSFMIGDLDSGKKTTIVYVAEIGAGARQGTAKNIAIARGSMGAESNLASATIEIVEDLFRSTATIVGRVITDGCGDPERRDGSGLAGVRVFLEDGTFAVTDKNGKFHFAAVKPGSHVVQLDTVTVPERYEVVNCEENTRFSDRGFSQFVDVQGGTLWRADFHLGLRPKERGSLGILFSSTTPTVAPEAASDSVRNIVDYHARISVDTIPVRNVRLSAMLPDGITYQPGSSRLNNEPLAEPEVIENTLTYRLGDLASGWTGTVRFTASVDVALFTAQAVVTADTPDAKNVRTPVAQDTRELVILSEERAIPEIVLRPQFASGTSQLTANDIELVSAVVKRLSTLNIKHITITGHTDSVPIRKNAVWFKDNYELSKARAETVAEFIRKGLNLAKHQVETVPRGPDQPVAPNNTAEGRALNRRVELIVYSIRVVTWAEIKGNASTGEKKAAITVGMRPGDEPQQASPEKTPAPEPKGMPEFDSRWLERAEPGLDLVWPVEGHAPSVPLLRAAVKHDPARQVKLMLNGREVDSIYFDGKAALPDSRVAVSTWRGLLLAEGDNHIAVIELDSGGNEVGRVSRIIHYADAPVTMEMIEAESRLVADGRSPIVVSVKLLDKDGHPARSGIIGEFSVDPPYLPLTRTTELQNYPHASAATERVKYEIGENGIARLELQPTSRSGEAVFRLALADGSRELRAWIKPEQRDWVLVGLAEGTAGYNTVTGNMETMAGSGQEDNYYQDGRLAFYAKGMIKGEWLLTAAYDSARETADRPRMYQTIDPNKYYLLYGDATEQYHDAASAKQVYVKLERSQFYALFGDFTTGLAITELSRYSRNLTGFKSEFKGERFEYTMFAADTDQAYIRDEIPGDGTSGLYYFSRRNIVINSERIAIETRDRFKSEAIVSIRPLARNLDYTIDYESGTVFFKAPVPGRDENFNPVFIVAEYETFDSGNAAYTYGGRAGVKGLNNRVQAGVTHVHEGAIGAEGDLSGADASVQLGPSTQARGEVSKTKADEFGAVREGSAYLAELRHRSGSLEGRVYAREQEPGFGLGQQNGSESGTRKTGASAAYRIGRPWTVSAEAFRQENITTGAERVMAEGQALFALPRYELFSGLRHAEDSFADGRTYQSEQFFAGTKYRFTDSLSGGIRHDQTLNSSDASVDFPTRTTIGMDYLLTPDTTLFANQELTRGSTDAAMTRAGIKTAPWNGARMNSSMERQITENGARLFAVTGLKQGWQVTKQWSVDAGVDRSATVRETGSYRFNLNVPPASGGSEDFTAVFIGGAYRQVKWSWTGRIEERRAEREEKRGVFMGANGEVKSGLGLAAGLQAFRTSYETGERRTNSDLRLAAVYRPIEANLTLLERLDYLQTEQEGTTFAYKNWRVVNNLVTNYKFEGKAQVSFQYGFKYVGETIEQNDYRGYTDLTGIECRYDLTKKWDFGLRGSVLNSRTLRQKDYGSGASVGFTAARNLWISLGYNFSGFTDRDFSKAEFTAAGPFVKLRLKFDQVSAREAVKWIAGR